MKLTYAHVLVNPGRIRDRRRVRRRRHRLRVGNHHHVRVLVLIDVLVVVVAREIEVQAALYAELVLDDLLHVALETAGQGLDVQVVQEGVVVQGAHELAHHRARRGVGSLGRQGGAARGWSG